MELKSKFENVVFNIDKSLTVSFRVNSLDKSNVDNLLENINEMSNNGNNDLKLIITKYSKQRSLNANAYFHLLVNEIAEKLKIGNDECKIKMNLEYGTPATDKKGNKVIVKMPSDVDISKFYDYAKWIADKTENGLKLSYYLFYRQTHTLNTSEMARLIDGVVNEAKQLGIETKTPTQINELLSLWESENEKKDK